MYSGFREYRLRIHTYSNGMPVPSDFTLKATSFQARWNLRVPPSSSCTGIWVWQVVTEKETPYAQWPASALSLQAAWTPGPSAAAGATSARKDAAACANPAGKVPTAQSPNVPATVTCEASAWTGSASATRASQARTVASPPAPATATTRASA